MSSIKELNWLEIEILKLLKNMGGKADDCMDAEFKDKMKKLEEKYPINLQETLDTMRIDEKIIIEEYTPVIIAGNKPEGPCHKYSITLKGEKFLRNLKNRLNTKSS